MGSGNKGTLAILASSLILLPTIEFSELMSSSKGIWTLGSDNFAIVNTHQKIL